MSTTLIKGVALIHFQLSFEWDTKTGLEMLKNFSNRSDSGSVTRSGFCSLPRVNQLEQCSPDTMSVEYEFWIWLVGINKISSKIIIYNVLLVPLKLFQSNSLVSFTLLSL